MRILHLMIAAAVVALPPIAVSAAEGPAPKKDRMVCRREPTTGTRMAAPRVCMKQSEWDAVGERAKDDMRSSQGRQTVVRYGPGGRSTCPEGIPC